MNPDMSIAADAIRRRADGTSGFGQLIAMEVTR